MFGCRFSRCLVRGSVRSTIAAGPVRGSDFAGSDGRRFSTRRMDDFDQDLSHEVQFTCGVEGRVTEMENNDYEKKDKMEKIEKHLETLETNYDLVVSDRDRLERAFYHMQVWVSERLGWGAMDARPEDTIDVLTTFGESQPPGPWGAPSGSQ
ncbi:hypothetical protein Tco_1216543 [Tanacetum coccineum]